MITRIVAILSLATLLTACGRNPQLSALSTQPLKIASFRGGREASVRYVEPPSPEHELLAAWAAQHETGWSSCYTTYAPSTLVHGTNFSLNIHQTRVILNIDGGQYVHDAKAADFSLLSQ